MVKTYYILGLILLILVLIFGISASGSTRWINLYLLNLQPSELMKIAVIVCFARYYHRMQSADIQNYRFLLIPIILLINKIDKYLSYILVTPNFHKVHHHYVQPHTDSNYGNIFSIWDHIFGTVKELDIMKELVYGIDTHMERYEHSSIKNLLMIPFQPYRPPVGSKFNAK